ncbi:MAG TPA: protein kinase, partial [Planctomycetota bacterium]|nr:protein kinase [Planctomycetota bacterium]
MTPNDPGLEALLALALERTAREGPAALEALCRQLPEYEAELRAAAANVGASDRTADVPRRLGDFEIRREIGRGGMGVVYEAEQVSLRRTVALKVLPAHLTLHRAAVDRFRREALAAARLAHPSIVEVFSVGQEGDVHFFAMELVRGAPLDRLIEETKRGERPRDPVETAVRLVALVADALEHAHRHGVVHRDVKPSNILVRPDGTPVLTDFGLAREEGWPSITRTGEFAGTPYYVSPEQALARRGGIDHRTDVFSLGVTLYECLTLERPFVGETSQEVLGRILTKEPVDPQKRNPELAGDLATIVMKSLEKDPGRRYATAAAMADDLRAFLEYRPIAAKPVGPATRVRRWTRREPAQAALVAVLLVGVPALAALGGYVLAKQPELAAAEDVARRAAVASAVEEGFHELGIQKLAGLDDSRAAADAFERALALDPRNVEALLGLGMAQSKLEKRLEVLDVWAARGGAVHDPDAIARMRAGALRAAGREAEALALRATLGEPRTALACFVEGSIEIERIERLGAGSAPQARVLELFAQAVARSPAARQVFHSRWAEAAALAGDRASIRASCDALESLWPDSPRTWTAVAVANVTADPDRALAACERALRLDPSLLSAHDLRAGLLLRRGDVEGALAEARLAVERRPDQARFRNNLGAALLAKGDADAALAEFERAPPFIPPEKFRATECITAGMS